MTGFEQVEARLRLIHKFDFVYFFYHSSFGARIRTSHMPTKVAEYEVYLRRISGQLELSACACLDSCRTHEPDSEVRTRSRRDRERSTASICHLRIAACVIDVSLHDCFDWSQHGRHRHDLRDVRLEITRYQCVSVCGTLCLLVDPTPNLIMAVFSVSNAE